jgi:cellulose biosynthesis protein BcsQ
MFEADSLSCQVAEQVREHFATPSSTRLRRNVRLGESSSHDAGLLYDSTSKGAEAYRLLAKELLNQIFMDRVPRWQRRAG